MTQLAEDGLPLIDHNLIAYYPQLTRCKASIFTRLMFSASFIAIAKGTIESQYALTYCCFLYCIELGEIEM